MACIVAVCGGAPPVTRSSLLHLADVDPFRGGDADVWLDGAVALCAVSARGGRARGGIENTAASPHVQVVLDGRLDDRVALKRQLELANRRSVGDVSDADLVLHAYIAWGDDLVRRLIGDFVFCLWDGRRRRLLCVRDHFGVKPLYYAVVKGAVVVSNVLDAVRRYPGVSDRLLDRAVGDFLLFGDPQNAGDTLFVDVRRLPAAHTLVFGPGGVPVASRYWTLEVDAPLRYRDPREYVEHFHETLRLAVYDRMSDGPVGIMMSGGLDSTSVAAVALERPGSRDTCQVKAFTAVYDVLIPDEERYFSSLAAESLAVPIEHMPVDRYRLFERWDADARPPVPQADPLSAVSKDLLARTSFHADVALTGDGGDPCLFPATVPACWGSMPLGDLAVGVWRTMRHYGEMPLFGIRTRLRRLRARESGPPAWLAAPLLASYDATARWREVMDGKPAVSPRKEALAAVRSSMWSSTFESMDPGATGQPVEMRYPFFDRRLVSLALSLPSYPWCVNKTILRESMRGRLPDAIRLRKKAPLAGDPIAARSRWSMDKALGVLRAAPGVDRFVDLARFEALVNRDHLLLDSEPGTLAAVSLAVWLRHSASRDESGTLAAITSREGRHGG